MFACPIYTQSRLNSKVEQYFSINILSLTFSTGRYIEALHLVLSNAPLGSSNQQVKVCLISIKISLYNF